MRSLLALALVCLSFIWLTCSTKENKTAESTEDTTRYEAGIVDIVDPEQINIKGDFNGDGRVETGVIRTIKEGEPHADPWLFTLVFSDPAIHSLTFSNGQDFAFLINEGPINAIPGDELSVFTQGGTMGLAGVEVYSLSNGLWGQAMAPIASRSVLPDSLDLNDLVFLEKEKVFYYEYVNNALGGLEDADSDGREPGFYKVEAKLFPAIEPVSHRFLEEEVIGSIDVDGDGAEEMMRIVLVNNTEEFAAYRLEFSNPNIKPLPIGGSRCGGEVLVEGDLDGIRGSELSLAECGIMPNYNFISTFSYNNNRWRRRLDGIATRDILPEGIVREDLIFQENGGVFYYEDEEIDVFISTGNKAGMKKVKAELR